VRDGAGRLGDVEVLVVGTGLGALGAVLALIESGIKPLVVDVGRDLPSQLEAVRSRMALLPPERWSAEDVSLLARNDTAGRSRVPKKLVFGSDHFYAENADTPPHSFALGGFSAGWGGAFLPPRQEDLADWPVSAQELHQHARAAVRTLPLSEPVDELSNWFPPLREEPGPVLRLSQGQQILLDRVRAAAGRSGLSRVGVGQSRLMTSVASGDTPNGSECRMCGFCMAGCLYGSILSSGAVIHRLAAAGSLELLIGHRVAKFTERGDHVEVSTLDTTGRPAATLTCQQLLVGAGAVESARLVVRSLAPRTRTLRVLRTGGAVVPFASLQRLPSPWPNMNTQSSVFMDLVDPDISPHWVHVQLAPANELMLDKLSLSSRGRQASRARIRWAALERFAFGIVNLHSDHGAHYEMAFSDGPLSEISATRTVYPGERRQTVRRATATVRRVLRRAGLIALRPLQQDSADGIGYHLGGSLPMTTDPKDPTETDGSGRPAGADRVHVVDASVLPSLPGTTLGVLILANGHRIASGIRPRS